MFCNFSIMRFNFFYTTLLLGFLSACNQITTSDTKTITNRTDTVSRIEINTTHLVSSHKNENRLLFIANGSEPGWLVEFYTYKFRLVVDYGTDSLILENQEFETMNKDEDFQFLEEESKHRLTVNIKNKKCVEEGSGNKHNKTVVVTFKGKTYKGCGSYLK